MNAKESGGGRRLMTTHSLMGDKVLDQDGCDLGDLKELLLDLETGKIAYGIVQLGGVLGTGNKLYAVPWSVFETNREQERPVLPLDRDTLEKAPSFDKDHWPDVESDAWADEIDTYYRSADGKAIRRRAAASPV